MAQLAEIIGYISPSEQRVNDKENALLSFGNGHKYNLKPKKLAFSISNSNAQVGRQDESTARESTSARRTEGEHMIEVLREMRTEMTTLRNTIMTQGERTTLLESQIASLNAENVDFKTQIATLNSEKESFKISFDLQEQTITNLRRRVSSLENDKRNLKKEVKSASVELANTNEHFHALKDSLVIRQTVITIEIALCERIAPGLHISRICDLATNPKYYGELNRLLKPFKLSVEALRSLKHRGNQYAHPTISVTDLQTMLKDEPCIEGLLLGLRGLEIVDDKGVFKLCKA